MRMLRDEKIGGQGKLLIPRTTIVNAHGSMADLPDDAVWKLPDKFADAELISALETLNTDAGRRIQTGGRGREIVLAEHRPASCANRYAQALEAFYKQAETGLAGLGRMLGNTLPPEGDKDSARLAQSLARSLPIQPSPRQLLVDISELVQRDAKSGMLPPKLARLMVNLTQVNPRGARLWDPFCGSGTILMEAALLGCTQIVGSDLSEKAVADTERNMRWLEHHEKTGSEVTTLVHDAREPLPEELGTFELIVAEGYLGPSRRLNPEEASREIEELYQESLPQILSKLNASGTAIIAIPFFQTGQKKQFLHIETPKGFTMERGLLYARPHQRIGREILKLRRK